MKTQRESHSVITPLKTSEIKLVSTFADDAMFLPLLRDYVGELPQQFKWIRTAIRDFDLNRVTAEAHKLHGNGGMYGYPDLSEAAGCLEAASRQGQPHSLIDALADDLERIIDRIQTGLPHQFGS